MPQTLRLKVWVSYVTFKQRKLYGNKHTHTRYFLVEATHSNHTHGGMRGSPIQHFAVKPFLARSEFGYAFHTIVVRQACFTTSGSYNLDTTMTAKRGGVANMFDTTVHPHEALSWLLVGSDHIASTTPRLVAATCQE
eukprot:2212032-Amphidinium_carterae.1